MGIASVRKTMRERSNLWFVITLAYFLIPLVLLGIQILIIPVIDSTNVQYFIFVSGKFTLSGAFLANYLHYSPYHLQSNVAGFLFISTFIITAENLLLPYYNVKRTERAWYLTVLSYLLVLPFLISFNEIIIERILAIPPQIMLGFSGIVTALYGYLIFDFLLLLWSSVNPSKTSHYVISAATTTGIIGLGVLTCIYNSDGIAGGMLIHVAGFLYGLLLAFLITKYIDGSIIQEKPVSSGIPQL